MTLSQTRDISREALFIDGGWARPSDGGLIEVVSPSTEETIATAGLAGPADVERAVTAARQAFDSGPWPQTSVVERARILSQMADAIDARADLIAFISGSECGMVGAMAQGDRDAAARLLRYYADVIQSFQTSESVTGLFSHAEVRRVPLGVTAVVVPWNAPLSIAMFAIAPALAAGCTVVLKSPVETPLATYMLGEVAAEAGLPAGVLNVVCADREVSETLIRHPAVDKVAFTGSTSVGRQIASITGDRLVSTTLELGGKSAAIVLDDADAGEVATNLTPLTMQNNGQACTNVTRVLVPRLRHDEIVDAMVSSMSSFVVGDPFDARTSIGPVISERQRQRVESYLEIGNREGARLRTGGGRPTHLETGFYVEPTLFDNVDNSMRIAREEIFGPVVAVIDYDSEDEAIAIANDSEYGLSGNVWSPDVDRAVQIARRVRTGNIGINGTFLDFAIPFGGMKQSGIGRGFGLVGLSSFYETQAIHRSL
jgi:acyl-CoA reductase-like NAD-dependent aldehyde dehydrogenase